MRKNIALCLLALAACGPPKDVPVDAIVAAFHFCPVSECSDVDMGNSTRQLPYQGSDVTGRWCIEVKFTRNGVKEKAAVDVAKINGAWRAADPIMNSDCSYFS